MKDLVFATGNPHKIREVHDILGDGFRIRSLADIGCPEDLPESAATIEGNALQKARYVYDHFGIDCFAEDTGLEVDALDGAPGVYSARYAGESREPEANTKLLLRNLEGIRERTARFRTVVALILNGHEYTFEGVAEGQIAQTKTGAGGFGYDPVFVPDGYQTSFAEMSREEKNAISHRGKAIRMLVHFLQNNNPTGRPPR